MKRVLIAPLDWGLGHATRCIPIIHELQNRNCEVLLAGSGDSLELLKAEFSELKNFSIPAYRPEYPVDGSMVWKMATQLLKFIKTIRAEHGSIARIISDEKIDLVISDNRYGCWSATIPSVFITHQSNIMMPARFGWLAGIVRKLNSRLMKKFTVCWYPDYPHGQTLAGDLVGFMKDPALRVDYIGPLSRFVRSYGREKVYDIVAIFSGPEPQRTLMENIVMPQLRNSGLKYFAVRGLPSPAIAQRERDTVDFLTSDKLKLLIESAEIIIARSGYSTIMDLAALGKKAIFIPTPGQTEQQYLAKRLMDRGAVYSTQQHVFDLSTAIQEVRKFSGLSGYEFDRSFLNKALDKVMTLTLDAPR